MIEIALCMMYNRKKKGEIMKNQKVQITKIEPVEKPLCRTPLKEEYVCGKEQDEDVSLFNGYCAVGILERPIECGKSIRMLREDRNGVKAFGIFATSPVNSVDSYEDHTIVKTDNSVYKVEYI